MNAWFRFYSEFASDPKVQSMSESMQRRLVMLFCLRSTDTLQTLAEDDLAFALGISAAKLKKTKTNFVLRGFIDENWKLLNWDRRQFRESSEGAPAALSDAERARRYRERKSSRQRDASRDGRDASRDASVSVSGSVSEQKSEEEESTGLARARPNWLLDESYSRFADLARKFWPQILDPELAEGHRLYWIALSIEDKLHATANLLARIEAGEDGNFVKHMPHYLVFEWQRGPRPPSARVNGKQTFAEMFREELK